MSKPEYVSFAYYTSSGVVLRIKKKGNVIFHIRYKTSKAFSHRLSLDGKKLITCSEKVVKVFDLEKKEEIFSFSMFNVPEHVKTIRIDITDNNRYFYISYYGSRPDLLYLFDLKKLAFLKVITREGLDFSTKFSNDGEHYAYLTDDWLCIDGKELFPRVKQFAFTYDSKTLIALDNKGELLYYDCATRRCGLEKTEGSLRLYINTNDELILVSSLSSIFLEEKLEKCIEVRNSKIFLTQVEDGQLSAKNAYVYGIFTCKNKGGNKMEIVVDTHNGIDGRFFGVSMVTDSYILEGETCNKTVTCYAYEMKWRDAVSSLREIVYLFFLQRMFPLIFPDGVIEEIVSYLIGLDNKPLVKFLMDYIKKKKTLGKREMIKKVNSFL